MEEHNVNKGGGDCSRIKGVNQMMIEVDPNQLDGIVRAWLKETLESVQHNAASLYVHPEDAKTYKKDVKALKWLLYYIGED